MENFFSSINLDSRRISGSNVVVAVTNKSEAVKLDNENEDEEDKEEHVVEWTKQWDRVRTHILTVVRGGATTEATTTGGTVDTTQQHSPGLFLEQDIVALEQQSTSETSQFVRMVHRERLSLLRLRQEIHNTVHVWTEIMEGRVDNRHAAHTLENTVSKYQAPIRWKEWGGDWILATELGEFLELLKQRQQYWENVFVPSNAVALGAGVGGSVIQYQRQIWWGALSRPESLLGVVIYDSGHGWHLGGMGDVVGRVSGVFGGVVGWWCGGVVVTCVGVVLTFPPSLLCFLFVNAHQVLDGVAETGMETGAVIVTGLWLLGCHIIDSHIVDNDDGSVGGVGSGTGKVVAPNIVLRRRHQQDQMDPGKEDALQNNEEILVPVYAHRGSSVLLQIPLKQGKNEEEGRQEKAFWSLRGVKLLVQ